ncbi:MULTISPECIES: FecR family protein [Butyricimonas]|jgi:putative anti-sigma factor|uniref:DUF4974 domain-containing protein n=1 Tax=Butyricimonas paravirosa TaxID=1472417 RepID=A0A7X6BKK9_9BACT|nr:MULTISPECIES: FecR domain-containing protein [Odoribacteraceae]NJC20055.1 ferric-dicitrate binding protein FerR (iron transport regulator) [Butyricimonas paravirosa]RGG45987.1 DUF4974 domain-containing protein [Odoribacter sp. AF21-41]RHH89993.1 DUF4974 domain-containing protein [Odoribacter sp. AM16-33]WOF12320.1 DUF4974 domain-containing protein [Butyricimonas paravirosa]GGJ72831.1 iron dicitrate transporter FecR [Butyricimonas paravirosa]
MDKTNHISRIIADKVLGQELSGEDAREFEEWSKATTENEILFERVKSMRTSREILALEQEDYGEKMVVRVMTEKGRRERRTVRRRFRAWLGSAAAILLLFVTGWVLLQTGHDLFPEKRVLSCNMIVPGKVEAVLTFADGRTMNITDKLKEGELQESLRKEVVDQNESAYHTLSVPPGGEFYYALADGTKIWLNSDSELRFPASFTGDKRQVFLKGEAFFDVVKNKEQPFVVSLSRGNITVFGTRFNVTDYEESRLSTVLVEGSIGFETQGGQSIKLKPSERLVYDEANGTFSVEQVDPALYTAWIDKMFIFNGQPLSEIMDTLSRWYDFDISFETEDIKNIRLSGRLNRYQDIRVLLNTYEEVANIKFKIEGKSITISRK